MKKIESGHPDLGGIRWVTKAIDKKRTRPVLQCMLFTGRTFVGCGGHRMHTYKPEEAFDPGMYNIVKNTKDAVWLSKSEDFSVDDYVDWKHPFPKGKASTRFRAFHDDNGCAKAVKDIVYSLSESETINPIYVMDVLESAEMFTVHVHDDIAPVMFTNRRHGALIMTARY